MIGKVISFNPAWPGQMLRILSGASSKQERGRLSAQDRVQAKLRELNGLGHAACGRELFARPLNIDLRGRNSYSSGMKTTISEKGQITIPKAIREQAGIKPGQLVTFLVKHGVIHLVPVLSIEELQDIFRGMNIEGYREEVDRY